VSEQKIVVNEPHGPTIPLRPFTLRRLGPTPAIHGTGEQEDFFCQDPVPGRSTSRSGTKTEPEPTWLLRTRAVRAEGGRGTTVVHGQKIFTTRGPTPTCLAGLLAPTRDENGTRGFHYSSWDTVIQGGYSWTPSFTHDGAHHVNATDYDGCAFPVSMRVGAEKPPAGGASTSSSSGG